MATKKDIPDLDANQLEYALNASMARASQNENSKLDITSEEAANLKKAFQKPEFRSLFHEYLQEISDPANKKEYDEYLDTLERQGQLPEHVNLVRPDAGFCVKVKTKDAEKRKVFVNVCSSSTVEEPQAKTVTQGGRKGQSWQLPHIVGPQRMEQDKKGNPSETFDVCFHTNALVMAEANPAFKDMITRTALEAVVNAVKKVRKNNAYALDIDKYHILLGRQSIGDTPGTLNVPKDKADIAAKNNARAAKAKELAASLVTDEATKSSTSSAAPSDSSSVKNKAQKGEGAWSKKGFLNKSKTKKNKMNNNNNKKSKLIKEVSADEAQKKKKVEVRNADGTLQPVYKMVHRGALELANYMTDLTNTPTSTRPKELVFNINMPAISSARHVDLDVSETHLKVKVPKIYALCVELPFPVEDEKGKAKFDKSKRELVVTLPVQMPQYSKKELDAARGLTEGFKKHETNEKGNNNNANKPASLTSINTAQMPTTTDEGDYVLVESPSANKCVPSSASKKNTKNVRNPHLDSEALEQQAQKHQTLSEEIARRAAEAVAAEKARVAALPQSVGKDEYVCRQTGTSVTVLISVGNVQVDSVNIDVKGTGSDVTVIFSTKKTEPKGKSRTFELHLRLGGKVSAEQSRSSVSSKNVVLILHKEKPGAWAQIERNDEKENNASEHSVDGDAQNAMNGDDNVAPGEIFIKADKFSGTRAGYVFCAGPKGLGYYRDTGPHQSLESLFNDEVLPDEDANKNFGKSNEKNDEQHDEMKRKTQEDPLEKEYDEEDATTINVFENNFVFELD